MQRLLSPWKIATGALFVILLCVILRTFGDYGMSWDEEYRNNEGTKKLVYYQKFFAGHWQKYDNPEDNYPGFYDLVHQTVNLFQPCGPGTLGLIFSDHLLTALFAFLTVVAAYRIAQSLGSTDHGERAGFFAALFLVLFPHFYGHAFINPKDIPFACMYLWALYYTLKLLNPQQPINAALVAKLTIVYGLTLGVRLGGIFFFGFMVVALILRAFLRRKQTPVKQVVLPYIGLTMLVAAGAFLVMLPWWPFAHPDPLGALWHSLVQVAGYPWNGPVMLNGHTYAATALPWYYLPEMLAITTPEFLLVLGFIGVAWALVSTARKAKTESWSYLTPKRLALFFVGFSFFFPVLAVVIKHATLYDGIRHFLFVLAPWAIISGLALDKILSWMTNQAANNPSPLLRYSPAITYALVVLFGGAIALEDLRLHPYEFVYYNHLAGGTYKAAVNFETDFWGTSHREAVELLAKHLALHGDKKIYKVTSPMAPWLVADFLPANMVYVDDDRQADFFISFLRFNAHMWSDGTVMDDCIVQREGVPLAIVRDRRKIIKEEMDAINKGHPSNRFISGIIDMLPLF